MLVENRDKGFDVILNILIRPAATIELVYKQTQTSIMLCYVCNLTLEACPVLESEQSPKLLRRWVLLLCYKARCEVKINEVSKIVDSAGQKVLGLGCYGLVNSARVSKSRTMRALDSEAEYYNSRTQPPAPSDFI